MFRPFEPRQLTNLLYTATEQAFHQLCTHTAGEHLYTFGLYTNGEGTYIFPTANTEEALLRTAYMNAASDESLVLLQQQSLRWSPCDWAYHEFADDGAFAAVDRLLATGWTDTATTFVYDPEVIYACCVDALAELRRAGLFEVTTNAPPILVNVFMGDQSDEARLAWATILNTSVQCVQFQHEMEQGDTAFRQLIDSGR